MGKERRRYKGRNREYKDTRPAVKALVVNKLIAIFYTQHKKLWLVTSAIWQNLAELGGT